MTRGQIADPIPATRTRAFWIVVGYAAILGLVMGLVAVAFVGIVDWMVELIWSEGSGVGLFEGEPWWILLIGAFGLLAGIIRKVLKVEPGAVIGVAVSITTVPAATALGVAMLLVNLLGLLSAQVLAFTAAKHLPSLRQPHARGRIA